MHRRVVVIAVAATTVLVWGGLAPVRARAHPGPGAPPEFVLGECVTVVDTREQAELSLAYNVGYDDVTFGLGEIQLPDSKTHQFLAVAGTVVKVAGGNGYQLFPFDAAIEQPLELPLWFDQDDVQRAAAAAGPLDMTGFTADQVGSGDVLAARLDVSAYLRVFGDKGARVPISEVQARMGVRWDLRAVPAGVYTVGGYVFSPPFNDWAMRPGVIKLVDGQHDVPAVVVDPIDAFVYAGQGRRVGGCVNAPAGSNLSAWVRAEDQPGAQWEPWLEQEPLTGDRFELCLANPKPGRAGLLRVRVVVTAPDGSSTAAYSPDTVLAVATAAGCTQSATICCPQPIAMPPDDAGSASSGGQGASAVDAKAPVTDAGTAMPPLAGPAMAPVDVGAREPDAAATGGAPAASEARASGGCTVSSRWSSEPAWVLFGLLGLLRRLRRQRSAAAQHRRAAVSRLLEPGHRDVRGTCPRSLAYLRRARVRTNLGQRGTP